MSAGGLRGKGRRRGTQLLMLLLMLVLGVLWMSSAEEPCLEESLLSGVDSGGGRRLWLQLRVVRFHHHLRWRVRNDITWKAEREKRWRCQFVTLTAHNFNSD